MNQSVTPIRLAAAGFLAFCATNAAAGEQATVAQLAAGTFHRVAGSETGGACLDIGPEGSWYSQWVGSPTVDFDGETYRMWFVGGAPTKDAGVPYGHYERIGLATSRDGLHWKIGNDGQPVLDLGPSGSADSKGLAHPYVQRVGKKFMMWYGGIDGTVARDLGLLPGHVRVERLCLATSEDGVHWTRANGGKPVMDIGPKGSVDSIQATGMHILKIADEFMMWYGAYNGDHTIAMATSPDGVRWTRTNGGKPVEGLVGGAQGQLGMSVHHDGARYFMFYCGDLGNEWKMYAATSDDGVRWKRLRNATPVLGLPRKDNFGTAGRGSNHSVHPSQILIQGRKVRVWYTGEADSHQRIGLMEAVLR
jgi:hypothetical protein